MMMINQTDSLETVRAERMGDWKDSSVPVDEIATVWEAGIVAESKANSKSDMSPFTLGELGIREPWFWCWWPKWLSLISHVI